MTFGLNSRGKLLNFSKFSLNGALGDCLYSVPEYSAVWRFFSKPVNESNLTVLEAISVLEYEKAPEPKKFSSAFLTIKEANKVAHHYLKAMPHFPPQPVIRTAQGVFSEIFKFSSYPGINHVAALDLARQRGCEPGHASILELENYAKLMSEFKLVK